METLKPGERLDHFIERTLLKWPPQLRVYHIGSSKYACYESDEQWEKHLIEIDKKIMSL